MPEGRQRGLASARRLSDLTNEAASAAGERITTPVPAARPARQRRTLWLPERIQDAVREMDWGRKDAVMRALDLHGVTIRDGTIAPAIGLGEPRSWGVTLRARAWQRIESIADERDWSVSNVVATLLAQMPELGLLADSDELAQA